jgi:hypothetical protein
MEEHSEFISPLLRDPLMQRIAKNLQYQGRVKMVDFLRGTFLKYELAPSHRKNSLDYYCFVILGLNDFFSLLLFCTLLFVAIELKCFGVDNPFFEFQ